MGLKSPVNRNLMRNVSKMRPPIWPGDPRSRLRRFCGRHRSLLCLQRARHQKMHQRALKRKKARERQRQRRKPEGKNERLKIVGRAVMRIWMKKIKKLKTRYRRRRRNKTVTKRRKGRKESRGGIWRKERLVRREMLKHQKTGRNPKSLKHLLEKLPRNVGQSELQSSSGHWKLQLRVMPQPFECIYFKSVFQYKCVHIKSRFNKSSQNIPTHWCIVSAQELVSHKEARFVAGLFLSQFRLMEKTKCCGHQVAGCEKIPGGGQGGNYWSKIRCPNGLGQSKVSVQAWDIGYTPEIIISSSSCPWKS